jgi:hypothetical protein
MIIVVFASSNHDLLSWISFIEQLSASGGKVFHFIVHVENSLSIWNVQGKTDEMPIIVIGRQSISN